MGNPLVDMALDPQGTAERFAAFPQLVGIQVAGMSDEGLTTGAAGVVDLGSKVPATQETRFRPGSITKLLTSTLVMQCVDDRRLALDDPISTHVPEFRLAIGGAAERVTMAHLISHSSGIDAGDLFVDTGDDDDCRARYVELLRDAGLLFDPGTCFSYCNAGFVLAALAVERVTGSTFEETARSRVLDPLGMTTARFLTGKEQDALGQTTEHARGHLAGFGGAMALPHGTLSRDPACSRGLAPAGGTLSCTATDLARFAGAHLGLRGVPPVLSADAAETMRQLHAVAPGGVTKMAGVGFGWQVWRGADGLLARIGGANPGQSGVVATDPRAGHAVAVLTNSDQGVNAVSAMLDGFGPAATPDDDPAPSDLSPYTGRYGCHAFEVSIDVGGNGGLVLSVIRVDDARWGATRLAGLHVDVKEGMMAGLRSHALTPVDRTTFATPLGPIAFLRDGGERPAMLRWRMRVLHRINP